MEGIQNTGMMRFTSLSHGLLAIAVSAYEAWNYTQRVYDGDRSCTVTTYAALCGAFAVCAGHSLIVQVLAGDWEHHYENSDVCYDTPEM